MRKYKNEDRHSLMAGRAAPAVHWLLTIQVDEHLFDQESFNTAITSEVGPVWLTYAAWQTERGEQTDRLHIQLFLKSKRKLRLTSISQLPAWTQGAHGTTGVHAEKAYKPDEARLYCMKEDSRVDGPWEYGKWDGVAQGRRTDLDAIWDLVRGGGKDADILDAGHASAFIRYHRGVWAARAAIPSPLVVEGRRVYLCYGPPGCGKSHLVRFGHRHGGRGDSSRLWISIAGAGSWFDRYSGQRVALFEELAGRYSGVRLTDLLQWLDKYTAVVNIKGGTTVWAAKYIWITTNIHPSEWYDYSNRLDHYWALKRRFYGVFEWENSNWRSRVYCQQGEAFWDSFWKEPQQPTYRGPVVAHVERPDDVRAYDGGAGRV